MNGSSETRASLLIRLKDSRDREAWYEFEEIYRPVVLRLAQRNGLQAADADDLVQQVFSAVARAIEHWQSDPQRARFRTWLHRITRNQILNALTRGPRDRGTGDTAMIQQLRDWPAADGPASELVQLESRRELFRWAARQIRDEFQPDTWQAFWLTAVEGQDPETVARRLARSVGSVYTARSRVVRRLRERLAEIEGE